jgi:hypothetical protein
LLGICDSDWVGCVDNMKALSSMNFLLVFVYFHGHQRSNKPPVTQFSTKVEYISTSLATSQAIWLNRILKDVGEKHEEATLKKSTIAVKKESRLP